MKCVFFDLDGTIADTETLKAEALSLAVKNFNGNAGPEVYKSVMGKSWEEVTKFFFDHAQISVDLDVFNSVFRNFYISLIETQLTDTRKITKYIHHLKTKSYSIALVTSASPWMVEHILQKLDLQKAFDLTVTNADVTKHKPHPEAYLLAISKLNAHLASSFAFEDSESGFQAANGAQLKVYGVRHSYNTNHNFEFTAGAIHSFEECLKWDIQ